MQLLANEMCCARYLAELHGTNAPMWASITGGTCDRGVKATDQHEMQSDVHARTAPARHVDRMRVLFPPMLGPVISMARELSKPNLTSFGTTTLAAVLSVRQGCLTSFRSITQPASS